MKRLVNKKAIKILAICSILVIAVVCFLYSLKYPVTSKIDYVSIDSFSANDAKDARYVNTYLKYGQIFYDSDTVLSDNISDYILVIYRCKVKCNCISSVNLIYCIVNKVLENDNSFISAHRLDFPMQTSMYIPTDTSCYVLMNRKGLTDEELYEKIKSVELDVIYKHKGEAGEVEVKGIDSLDFDDIVWRKK